MKALVADVAVFLPVPHLLSYVIPENLRDSAEVGKRVLVPVRSSVEMGIIVSVKGENCIDNLKPVMSILDEVPVLSKELIDLCMWISQYYLSPPGLAFQLAVPSFLRNVTETKLAINNLPTTQFLPSTITHQILSLLKNAPMSKREIKKKLRIEGVEEELDRLLKEGILKEVYLPKISNKDRPQEQWIRLKDSALVKDEELIKWQKKAPNKAKVYLHLLYEAKEVALKELLTTLNVSKGVINSLYKEGIVEIFYKTDFTPFNFQLIDTLTGENKIFLTDEQEKALSEILVSIEKNEFRTFLLHGITGSGKTEVYIRSIQEIISRGKQCLFLVPEISLTPQTLSRLIYRFGEKVAVIHSGITEKQRYNEWHRIREGKVDIVVGVRSALFAPFERLGLVIIDEEHEHTYKQEEAPRYHARDVGIVRAKLNSAVCILGSATPSLESFVNAERGKYTLLRLTKRVASGNLPSIQIVDLRKESKSEEEIVISEILRNKIRERLEKNEQIMLLINRRGFAPVIICPSCGWVLPCPNCRTSLNYHRKGGVVICHYCNYKDVRPDACKECGFAPLIFLGAGTQRVEDLLAVYFPYASISRIDTDTANSQRKAYQILKDFAEGRVDILVGTQMIAKGHDYPRVTLVGVINADVGLTMPNFRSPEFTFQLLMQVAGRAGRREYPGEVIIQTYMPNHYVLKAVQTHDYNLFFEKEIKFRSKVGYPPFNRMVHFGIESDVEDVPSKVSYLLVDMCKNKVEKEGKVKLTLLGPAPAIYRKLRGKYRWQFAILCNDVGILLNFAKRIIEYFEEVKPDSKTKLVVDVDPYQIY